MNNELRTLIERDIHLKEELLEQENNGANKSDMFELSSEIINNAKKVNELLEVDINEEKTIRRKIKKVEELPTDLKEYNKEIAGFGALSAIGAIGMVAMGIFAFKYGDGMAFYGTLPCFLSLGLGTGHLIETIADKTRYKKEIMQYVEDIKNYNNERGLTK